MEVILPADCGNAPRMVIVGDFIANWASGDHEALSTWLSEDASWTLVGTGTYSGPGSARDAIPQQSPDRLVFQSIVTHGRLASCDGYLQNGPDRTPFSHAIRFAGATKSAKIAEIRTYMIAREGT